MESVGKGDSFFCSTITGIGERKRIVISQKKEKTGERPEEGHQEIFDRSRGETKHVFSILH